MDTAKGDTKEYKSNDIFNINAPDGFTFEGASREDIILAHLKCNPKIMFSGVLEMHGVVWWIIETDMHFLYCSDDVNQTDSDDNFFEETKKHSEMNKWGRQAFKGWVGHVLGNAVTYDILWDLFRDRFDNDELEDIFKKRYPTIEEFKPFQRKYLTKDSRSNKSRKRSINNVMMTSSGGSSEHDSSNDIRIQVEDRLLEKHGITMKSMFEYLNIDEINEIVSNLLYKFRIYIRSLDEYKNKTK